MIKTKLPNLQTTDL